MEISTQIERVLEHLVIESSYESIKMKESIKRVHQNGWPIIEPSRDFFDDNFGI